jgi:cytidine deaminase
MTDQELIDIARALVKPRVLSRPDMDAATVGSAILSKGGNVYTGICVSVQCGIGFCAEHAAVAEMIKGGETAIDTIVAAGRRGILPPCGRCRELLVQVDSTNLDCRVLLPGGDAVPLRDLLPRHWLEGG